MVFGFLANRQILRAAAHIHFNKNDLLNKNEREYAKRCYDYCMKLPDTLTMTFDMFNYSSFDSDLYKKWGLGRKRLFIRTERHYIRKIEDIEIMWMIYHRIDLNNLDALEENLLQKIHDHYGQRPLRQEDFLKFVQESNGIFFDAESMIDVVEAYEYILVYLSEIFNFTEIDDRMIIFIYILGPVWIL